MSATVYPLQPGYQQPNETPICDDDDDISLANIMSRKLQVNQQVMINNWTSTNYQYCYGDSMMGYQQPQPQQPYYNQQAFTNPQVYNNNNQQMGYSRNSGRPRTPNLGTNQHHRSSLQKSRSTPLNTHQTTKIRVSSSPKKQTSSQQQQQQKSSPKKQYSTSSTSSISSSTTSSSYNNRKYIMNQNENDCESQTSITTPPSLIDDNSTRRSSIYSLTSTTSINNNNNNDIHSSSTSLASSSSTIATKKVTVKRSFSKKLKNVFIGGNNNNNQQQQQQQQAYQPTLRKTPSSSSLSSVISANTITSENNSIRNSFVSLFRRPSKLSTHFEQDDHHSSSTNEMDSSSKNIPVIKNQRYQNNNNNNSNSSSSSSSSSETSTITNISKNKLNKDKYELSIPLNNNNNNNNNNNIPYISSTSYLQHSSPILKPSTNYNHIKSDGSIVSISNNDDNTSIYSGSIHSSYTSNNKKQIRKQSISNQSIISYGNGKSIQPNTSKVRFTRTVQVHETFSAREYDRQGDEHTTCHSLTPIIAMQIKQELNEYKLNEMEVHPHSRQYTHFFI